MKGHDKMNNHRKGGLVRGPMRGMAMALALGVSSLALTGVAFADYDDALKAYSQAKYEDAIDLWQRYAVAGDVKSKNALGDVYSGKVIEADILLEDPAKTGAIPQSDVDALAWYILAANHDFDSYNQSPTWREVNAKYQAQERLPVLQARMTDEQVEAAQDQVISILAAQSEFDLYRLGTMYQSGSGLPKDNIEALKYFTLAKGRKQNSNAAASDAAKFLMTKMSSKDIEKAMKLAANWQPPLPAALDGKTPAQEKLERDLKELRDRETAMALANIETEFQNNDHLIQSALAALGFYLGNVDGKMGPESRVSIKNFQYSLVENDRDMSEDEKQQVRTGVLTVGQKVELIRLAAKREHPRSQYVYGIMYAEGIGVSTNGAEAVKWLTKSANYGYALAHNALGTYYRDGILGEDPLKPNVGEATFHFGQAVALGYEPARKPLLELYEFVPATDKRGSND